MYHQIQKATPLTQVSGDHIEMVALTSQALDVKSVTYRIHSINHPGRLLNFHHFQKVKYVYFATKQ